MAAEDGEGVGVEHDMNTVSFQFGPAGCDVAYLLSRFTKQVTDHVNVTYYIGLKTRMDDDVFSLI